MAPRGEPRRMWPVQPRPPPSLRRFLPIPEPPTIQNQPPALQSLPPAIQSQPRVLPSHSSTLQNQSQSNGHSLESQFVSPQQIFQEPLASYQAPSFDEPRVPFTSASFHEPASNTFLTSGPLVHEGFIPAPGRENVEDLFPGLDDDPFRNHDESSDDNDSEFERRLAELGVDDYEKDKDYSTEEEVEGEEDEMDLEVEFEDEEEEPAPKRSRPKTRGTRGGRRGRSSGRGRGGYDGIARKRRKKTGVRGRPKGSKAGPRAVADPGPEFKELQQQANEALLRQDYATAADYAQQAVALNPEIFAAHSTLSEIYSAMGQKDLSVTALIVGANTKRDAGLWWYLLERIDEVDETEFPRFTTEHKLKLKVGCLSSIIALDSDNYEARSRKLDVDSQRGPGRISACVKQCGRMLRIRPHEYDILKQMATLGTSNPKAIRIHLKHIIETYDRSIAYFTANEDPANSTLDWNFLNIYLDLLDHAKDYGHALSRLKKLARWKQGREVEIYWDDYDDDREFDNDDVPRRIVEPRFERLPNAKYGNLPIEIRVKLGVFRCKQSSNFPEALSHLEMLRPEDEGPDAELWDCSDLFRVAADTLHTTGHDKDALRFYEPLLRHAPNELRLKSLLGLYTSYKNLEEPENAEQVIPLLKAWDESLEDLAILAKFFQDVGMDKEARERAEVVFANRHSWRLRKLQYRGYEELVAHFKQVRKAARGKYIAKKKRIRKYMKKVKAATNVQELDSEKNGKTVEGTDMEPRSKRPAKGLFRAKGRLPTSKPQTFLPIEPLPDSQETAGVDEAQKSREENGDQTAQETNDPQPLNPVDKSLHHINQTVFRRRMAKLAVDHADQLQALRTQQREVVASFERLDGLCDAADEGDEAAVSEYLSITRELIEEFSTFDLFYSDRYHPFRSYFRRTTSGEYWKDSALMALAVDANRVEDGGEGRMLVERSAEAPQEFYGVHFDRWVDVFARSALLLARKGEVTRCFSILDVSLQSNIVYCNMKYRHRVELSRLASALAVDSGRQATDAVRWLLRAYPFGSELFRIFSAASRLCSLPDGFSHNASAKVLLRYIKTIDYVLLPPELRSRFNFRGDEGTQGWVNSISKDLAQYVKGHDPVLFVLYGYVLMCGGSYLGALLYFFRAFAVMPDDPVINLSIGTAYIQQAMKRLTDNRQFQIQQGVSFINRYYDLRTKDGVALHCSEAEYNVARIWHGLGLMTEALAAYERCIAISERVKKEAVANGEDAAAAENFASEAAFGLQSICMLSGDFERACKVTESVLVLE